MLDGRSISSTVLTLILASSTLLSSFPTTSLAACRGHCDQISAVPMRESAASTKRSPCCCRGGSGDGACVCSSEQPPASTPTTAVAVRRLSVLFTTTATSQDTVVKACRPQLRAGASEAFRLSPSPRTLLSRLCVWRI